jgi:hypothetical protein
MRTLIHALAAAALVATALAPPTALAKPMGIVLPPKPIGVVLPPKPMPILGITVKPKPILGIVIPPKPHPILGIVIPPHPDHDHDHWGGWWWWHHHHTPWIVEQAYSVPMRTVPVATSTYRAPSGPCTCLTKTYLADGSVQFQDVCTKEAAIAAPGG